MILCTCPTVMFAGIQTKRMIIKHSITYGIYETHGLNIEPFNNKKDFIYEVTTGYLVDTLKKIKMMLASTGKCTNNTKAHAVHDWT